MTILLATGNAHKVEEISAMLRNVPNLEVVSLNEYSNVKMPEEDGATIPENAYIKAEACAQQSGLPTLADDSGLEVDALNGAPGVHSARWVEGSDIDRTTALLERLRDIPDEQRTARYRCAICVVFPDGRVLET
jgi:XTP/dITP diphosphohydrolase